jgi:hypothetical protein
LTSPPIKRTAEQRQQQTLEARRAARYKFAEARINRIVEGSPELTEEQLSRLAVLLYGGGGE